jgi:hypothetical protein
MVVLPKFFTSDGNREREPGALSLVTRTLADDLGGGFDSRRGHEIYFLLSKLFRLVIGPIQLPVKWIPGVKAAEA